MSKKKKETKFVIRLRFLVNMFGRQQKSAIIHNFSPPLMTMASSWILLNVANPLIVRNEIWASWWSTHKYLSSLSRRCQQWNGSYLWQPYETCLASTPHILHLQKIWHTCSCRFKKMDGRSFVFGYIWNTCSKLAAR